MTRHRYPRQLDHFLISAHAHKDRKILRYAYRSRQISIEQDDASHDLGTTVWPSAEVLCQYMIHYRQLNLHVDRVLELGSGTGLIAVALQEFLDWTVVSTDLQHLVRGLLASNLVLNGQHASCPQILDWTQTVPEDLLDSAFDVIVVADGIYSSTLAQHLARTIYIILLNNEPKTEAIIALEKRDAAVERCFFDKCRVLGIIARLICQPLVQLSTPETVAEDVFSPLNFCSGSEISLQDTTTDLPVIEIWALKLAGTRLDRRHK